MPARQKSTQSRGLVAVEVVEEELQPLEAEVVVEEAPLLLLGEEAEAVVLQRCSLVVGAVVVVERCSLREEEVQALSSRAAREEAHQRESWVAEVEELPRAWHRCEEGEGEERVHDWGWEEEHGCPGKEVVRQTFHWNSLFQEDRLSFEAVVEEQQHPLGVVQASEGRDVRTCQRRATAEGH